MLFWSGAKWLYSQFIFLLGVWKDIHVLQKADHKNLPFSSCPVGRMIASLLPPVMWGAGIEGSALTAADKPVTHEGRRLSHIWE